MKDDERPANLSLWWANGCVMACDPKGGNSDGPHRNTDVSLGITDSEKTLGFIVTHGNGSLDFVLSKKQVERLAMYLNTCVLPRLGIAPTRQKRPPKTLQKRRAKR